jgi:putative hemolysin
MGKCLPAFAPPAPSVKMRQSGNLGVEGPASGYCESAGGGAAAETANADRGNAAASSTQVPVVIERTVAALPIVSRR